MKYLRQAWSEQNKFRLPEEEGKQEMLEVFAFVDPHQSHQDHRCNRSYWIPALSHFRCRKVFCIRIIKHIYPPCIQVVSVKVNNPGSVLVQRQRQRRPSFARAQMLWAEMHRGSEHRLQILHGQCVCIVYAFKNQMIDK